MSYWIDQPPSASNLRLFQSDGTWLAWDDREEDGKTRRGARGQVEERLLSSLNATNLMALLGSGASFAAKNAGGKQAPGMGDLWDDARQKVGEEDFDKVVAEVWGATGKKDIESLLSLCKMTVELEAARGAAAGQDAAEDKQVDLPSFVQKAEQAILDRVDFVSEQTDLISHKEFLRRLARRSAEKARVKLFTTNYDRCIEEAAVARNLALIDGFSHSAVQRFNRDHFQQDIVRRSAGSTRADYVDGVFHLYKLHGSMDWRRRKSDGVVIRRLDHDGNHEPVLIYPRSSKYQEAFAPPYLDMFAAWQAALREPDTTLIVSGFGFADDHISAPIWSALAIPVAQRAAVLALMETVAALTEITRRQEHLIAELNHALHGKRSEKLTEDERQLAFEDLSIALAEVETEKETRAAKAGDGAAKSAPKRTIGNLPAALPRIEEIIEPASLICPCGCGIMHKIGEDRSERLDIVPAQLRVIVTVRPKYACRTCTDGVTQAPAPSHLIMGGLPTEATLAHVLISKYADHLPLYRQSQILARAGLDLHRAVLADWVGKAAFHLKPIVDRMAEHLKRSGKLFMDETTAPVLDPGRGATKTGYLWALARDDRPWGGEDPPGVVYFYAPGRAGENAETFLTGFDGILQIDGYTGYNRLTKPSRKGGAPIRVAHCWAHARRKLKEIFDRDGSEVAAEGLRRIAEFYAVEADIRGISPGQRLSARQARTAPLVAAFGGWLLAQRRKISAKSRLGEKLTYIHNHWDGLQTFLTDGRVEIDNNRVENLIRPIALNRKNALFAGHDEGGKAWGRIASLIETCKINGIEPFAYLKATLTALANGHPQSRLDDLLPWNFTPSK